MPTILIADDNVDLRAMLRQLLESHGYRVLEAAGGREATEATVRERPSLVIMDLGMPDMDGLSAVAAGGPEKAARLWGAAQAIFDAADYKLDKVDQDFVDRYVGEARAAAGDEAYGAALREGRAMRLEHAVALARETR